MEDFKTRMELVSNTSKVERRRARENAGKITNKDGLPLSRDVFYQMKKKKSEEELSYHQRILFYELEKMVYLKLNLERDVRQLKENASI